MRSHRPRVSAARASTALFVSPSPWQLEGSRAIQLPLGRLPRVAGEHVQGSAGSEDSRFAIVARNPPLLAYSALVPRGLGPAGSVK